MGKGFIPIHTAQEMGMVDPQSFAKMVPGFDFLQGLMKNAGSALPGLGQWVSPTMSPEEIERKIEELKSIQFWLEQNAKMIGATIQALEVQRMTLSALQSLNVPLGDLKEAFRLSPTPEAAAPKAASRTAAASPKPSRSKPSAKATPTEPPAIMGMPGLDPNAWFNALAKQFTHIAANAVKDTASEAARQLASQAVNKGLDVAGETIKRAAAVPGEVADLTRKNVVEPALVVTQAATHTAAAAAGEAVRAAKVARQASATQREARESKARKVAARKAVRASLKGHD